MTNGQTILKQLMRTGLVCGTLGLSGCGGDGVALNGKIFDWMGVSESAQSVNKSEPKLVDRAPLVVPPNLSRLPEPGSEAPQDANFNLNDPDQKRIAAAAEREKLHRQYCSGDKNWQERALNRNAEAPRSPFGPCNQFIGNALQPSNSGTQTKTQ